MQLRGFIVIITLFFFMTASKTVFYQFHLYALSIGIDPKWIGLIISADSISFIALQPIASVFARGSKTRLWMLAGITTSALSLFLYQAALTTPLLFVLRFLQGAGMALFISASMADMVRYVPTEKSGSYFGALSIATVLPNALIPPILSVSTLSFPEVAVLTGAAVLLSSSLLSLLPDIKYDPSEQKQGVHKTGELIENLLQRGMGLTLLSTIVLFSSYSCIFFYLRGYGEEIGINNPGIFFSTTTMAMIVIRVFASKGIDRADKRRTASWSFLLLALCHLHLPYIKGDAMFYVNAALTGIGWGIATPLLNSIVFDISRPEFRAFNLNMAMLALQISFFTGPFIGGLILAGFGYNLMFYTASAAAVMSALAMSLIPRTLFSRV